jgi:hypothetical protein
MALQRPRQRLANEKERRLEVRAADIPFLSSGGSGTTPEAARPNKPSWTGVPETGQWTTTPSLPSFARADLIMKRKRTDGWTEDLGQHFKGWTRSRMVGEKDCSVEIN